MRLTAIMALWWVSCSCASGSSPIEITLRFDIDVRELASTYGPDIESDTAQLLSNLANSSGLATTKQSGIGKKYIPWRFSPPHRDKNNRELIVTLVEEDRPRTVQWRLRLEIKPWQDKGRVELNWPLEPIASSGRRGVPPHSLHVDHFATLIANEFDTMVLRAEGGKKFIRELNKHVPFAQAEVLADEDDLSSEDGCVYGAIRLAYDQHDVFSASLFRLEGFLDEDSHTLVSVGCERPAHKSGDLLVRHTKLDARKVSVDDIELLKRIGSPVDCWLLRFREAVELSELTRSFRRSIAR